MRKSSQVKPSRFVPQLAAKDMRPSAGIVSLTLLPRPREPYTEAATDRERLLVLLSRGYVGQ